MHWSDQDLREVARVLEPREIPLALANISWLKLPHERLRVNDPARGFFEPRHIPILIASDRRLIAILLSKTPGLSRNPKDVAIWSVPRSDIAEINMRWGFRTRIRMNYGTEVTAICSPWFLLGGLLSVRRLFALLKI